MLLLAMRSGFGCLFRLRGSQRAVNEIDPRRTSRGEMHEVVGGVCQPAGMDWSGMTARIWLFSPASDSRRVFEDAHAEFVVPGAPLQHGSFRSGESAGIFPFEAPARVQEQS